MPRPYDPDENLAPNERRAAIAAILAQGVLRLRAPRAAVSRPDRDQSETSKNAPYSLELGAQESPHVPVFKGGMNRRKGA